MDEIKQQINFNNLEDELKYLTCLIFSQKTECKDQINYLNIIKEKLKIPDATPKTKTSLQPKSKKSKIEASIKNEKNFKIFPHPIFKISKIPNENNPYEWFKNMDHNILRIPTFIGRFKELIYEK